MRSEAQYILRDSQEPENVLSFRPNGCHREQVLDMATGQPGGARVCSGSQKCSWEVGLHEIFGSEILEDEKTQSPQVPKGLWGMS